MSGRVERQSGWRAIAGALACVVACVGGCGGDAGSSSGGAATAGGKLRVVATVGMLADAARVIGGDRVEVTALMGPGVDPHLYKASEGDIRRLIEAQLILYVGLHLEGKMTGIFERMRGSKPTVAVGEKLPEHELRTAPGFAGTHDPHLWFDVALWSRALPHVAEAFAAADPGGAARYQQNLAAYQQELRALDVWVRERVAEVPAGQRVLVTAHDAFGYFGRAYDMEVVGLQGISTVTEAGLADIAGLVDMLVDRKIKAVFVETSVSERGVNAVIAGAAARGSEVRVGGTLYSDALGPAGSGAGVYVGMVRHNVTAIVEGLR
jgi:manganese/zinc/iron transport system substrate-binding protein